MNNKSKILMVAPDINSQGGISSVVKLYKNYGLDFINLPSYKNGNIFIQFLFYLSFIFKYIFSLSTKKNIELIHIHTASRGSFLRKYITFKIAKVFRKKIVFHIHGAEFELFYNESQNCIKKEITKALNASDLIIVLSNEWKKTISEISTNNNIKVLYNPTVIKEIAHVESESINVLFMGRLGKRKGIYDIIEAAKLLKNPNIEINLYGDGNLEEFEKLIVDKNLQEKIKIRGWISGVEKDEVLKNSDIFLLPSYNEGLPMSILEAMAFGLPTISTPVGGIPEAVEDGVNGFIVQPGDYVTLAEKIDLLANDKPLREQMGQEGYKMAKEKFDINIIINKLQDIYDELLR